VFTLPDGFTANADNLLVNNRFVPADIAIPLPGTLPFFASGLSVLGLLGWRRKKKAQAA